MVNKLLIWVVVILIFFIIIAIIFGIIVFDNLRNCETTENPYCPEFICQNGKPAKRIHSTGETLYSGRHTK